MRLFPAWIFAAALLVSGAALAESAAPHGDGVWTMIQRVLGEWRHRVQAATAQAPHPASTSTSVANNGAQAPTGSTTQSPSQAN
jgi:hypothetical protein